jgi:hypothetical protein
LDHAAADAHSGLATRPSPAVKAKQILKCHGYLRFINECEESQAGNKIARSQAFTAWAEVTGVAMAA